MATNTGKWIEIGVGVLGVGLLLFMLTRIFDLQSTLSGVSSKVETTDQRVARIADVLPEVRARVAWEEVNAQFTGFVALARPKQVSPDRWSSTVKLYEASSGKLQTFSIVTSEEHKDFLTYVVAGKVKELGPNDPTFTDLVAYSSQEKVALTFPSDFNGNMSFLLRKEQVARLSMDLRRMTGVEPESKSVGRVQTWKELAPRLGEFMQSDPE